MRCVTAWRQGKRWCADPHIVSIAQYQAPKQMCILFLHAHAPPYILVLLQEALIDWLPDVNAQAATGTYTLNNRDEGETMVSCWKHGIAVCQIQKQCLRVAGNQGGGNWQSC